MDWATQPDPFRRYVGAPLLPLPHEEKHGIDRGSDRTATPLNRDAAGWFLRYSMGLSAWKAYRETRWALRVNPSSGNLHPTEAYLVHDARICHYAPREHALEERASIPQDIWTTFLGGDDGFLVALTSIQWREAWKYGERAFRYCQHDVGHAIAALRVSAALFGWSLRLLPEWSDEQLATLLGIDRDDDRGDAEPEHPECIALVTPASAPAGDPAPLAAAARSATWHGRPNVLSAGHDQWDIIDRVTEVTEYPGQLPPLDDARPSTRLGATVSLPKGWGGLSESRTPTPNSQLPTLNTQPLGVGPFGNWELSRTLLLQRRSAVAFDGRSTLSRDRFLAMLSALDPSVPPFDAIDWPPHVHLVLFVHRVEGLTPGVYAYLRDPAVLEEWRRLMRPEFPWEEVSERLYLLVPTDVTWAANRVSCDQAIAGDGYFSLGMIARVESALRDRGEWFYRRLFWECGMIGQILYLVAEAASSRGTGIGCFYDDAVHEVLGLAGREWQSLYHFSAGTAVEDARLTSEPGYSWELRTT